MTQGRKTGGKDFGVGNPGGPGRPPLPDDLRAVKLLTSTELRARIQRMLDLNSADLTALINDPATKTLDKILGKIALMATDGGDQQRLDFLLNRHIGKVQEKIEVTMPKPFVVVRGSGEQVVMGVEKKDEE